MARFLFFLGLVFGGVFFHWSVIVFFAAVFALFFAMPLELIFAGLFLDSLIYISPPAAFTIGFIAIIIAEEFLKMKIKKEGAFGKSVILSSAILIFSLIFIFIYNNPRLIAGIR